MERDPGANGSRLSFYPAANLPLEGVSSMVEADETDEWVSARQLRLAPPQGHLYAYVLDSSFFTPIRAA
jgi:hypothetical protein